MPVREIKSGIYYVGAIDWDRRLFDELIPLPDGTTYNSYLIKGRDKTVLVDTVDPTKEKVLVDNLAELKVGNIDYIVSHHAEQDHSGSLPKILDIYKTAMVVTNPKCKEMLKDLLLIPEDRFITVNDRETLSLGGRTLEFIYAPWVHWPETMFTYLKEDKILFTCDFLGSHLAGSEMYAHDEHKVYESAKRYFAEIMMPYRTNFRNNLEKIKDLPIDIIAPSHGPLHDRPDFIIGAHKDWVSDAVKNEVVVPYVSMHGSVREMINYFVEALMQRGIAVKQFDLSRTDTGELAKALVDTATIVIGTPTVLAGAHPLAIYAAHLANALRPKARFLSIVGSYGWGGRMVEQLSGIVTNLKLEVIEPVVAKGHPKEADFRALDRLADDIFKKHSASEFVKKS